MVDDHAAHGASGNDGRLNQMLARSGEGIELRVGQRVLRPLQVGSEGDVVVHVGFAKRPGESDAVAGRAAGGCIGPRRYGRSLIGLIDLESGVAGGRGRATPQENQSQCWLHHPTGARSASLSLDLVVAAVAAQVALTRAHEAERGTVAGRVRISVSSGVLRDVLSSCA